MSLESCGSCDWEREHGLQIVFKQGLFVNKVGAFDGHLTNSDAYANEELENVIDRKAYKRMQMDASKAGATDAGR